MILSERSNLSFPSHKSHRAAVISVSLYIRQPQPDHGYGASASRGVPAYRVVQKTDTQFYFWDNFGNSAPILTILLLLQAEIYGA